MESYARIKHLQTRTWLHLDKGIVFRDLKFVVLLIHVFIPETSVRLHYAMFEKKLPISPNSIYNLL